MKNLVKFNFCTGTHIRYIKKGGTKSEIYYQEKRQRGPPLDFFSKILFYNNNFLKADSGDGLKPSGIRYKFKTVFILKTVKMGHFPRQNQQGGQKSNFLKIK